jgi:superfamily II DNA or RNA helicase
LNSLLRGWTHTGVVSLPCGVGKTVILGHFLKQCFYKNIIIVSPLRILAKQTLERLKAFLPTHTPLLVDVDGDLDVDHVKEGFSKTTIMSTTFKSFANLFSQLDMKNTFVVIVIRRLLEAGPVGEEELDMIKMFCYNSAAEFCNRP